MTFRPIQETFTRLASRDESQPGLLLTDRDDLPGWLTLADLATDPPRLEEILHSVAAYYKAPGLKPAAALWFGHVAYTLEAIAFACFLIERRVPDLSPPAIHLRLDPNGIVEILAWLGRSLAALEDDPCASHPDCSLYHSLDALRVQLRTQLIDALTPLVEPVSASSSLGRPGLWALAADYAAYALTTLAKGMGDEPLGITESRLFSAGETLLSRTRDFILVGHPDQSQYMIDRSSCCLFYRVEGGAFCHSCPRRPLEERILLARQRLDQAAVEVGA